jgi:hypothetical protein
MSSKDPDKTQQKPAPEPPQSLSDLPEVVTDEDGKLIKGGPSGHPWIPKPPT